MSSCSSASSNASSSMWGAAAAAAASGYTTEPVLSTSTAASSSSSSSSAGLSTLQWGPAAAASSSGESTELAPVSSSSSSSSAGLSTYKWAATAAASIEPNLSSSSSSSSSGSSSSSRAPYNQMERSLKWADALDSEAESKALHSGEGDSKRSASHLESEGKITASLEVNGPKHKTSAFKKVLKVTLPIFVGLALLALAACGTILLFKGSLVLGGLVLLSTVLSVGIIAYGLFAVSLPSQFQKVIKEYRKAHADFVKRAGTASTYPETVLQQKSAEGIKVLDEGEKALILGLEYNPLLKSKYLKELALIVSYRDDMLHSRPLALPSPLVIEAIRESHQCQSLRTPSLKPLLKRIEVHTKYKDKLNDGLTPKDGTIIRNYVLNKLDIGNATLDLLSSRRRSILQGADLKTFEHNNLELEAMFKILNLYTRHRRGQPIGDLARTTMPSFKQEWETKETAQMIMEQYENGEVSQIDAIEQLQRRLAALKPILRNGLDNEIVLKEGIYLQNKLAKIYRQEVSDWNDIPDRDRDGEYAGLREFYSEGALGLRTAIRVERQKLVLPSMFARDRSMVRLYVEVNQANYLKASPSASRELSIIKTYLDKGGDINTVIQQTGLEIDSIDPRLIRDKDAIVGAFFVKLARVTNILSRIRPAYHSEGLVRGVLWDNPKVIVQANPDLITDSVIWGVLNRHGDAAYRQFLVDNGIRTKEQLDKIMPPW